ncbi:MAG: DUF2171 domain-containing protein [Nitrososphaerales archaeon]
MDAGTMLRTNSAKAGELVEAAGEAAGGLVQAVGEAAGELVGVVGEAAAIVAKAIEETAGPLAEMIESKAENLAKSMEERAAPVAESVGGKVEALSEDLEEKLGQARKDVAASVKSFRFGRREGLILGVALGVFATVWLIRRIDRQAAAARLRAAGTRAGEITQGVTSRVGEATQGLTDKAGTLAGQAGERVGQVVQTVGTRAGDVVQQIRGQADEEIEGAKQRLSEGSAPIGEVTIGLPPKDETIGSGLDEATQAAIAEAASEVEQVQEETAEQARELGLSNGMKVVAFDGTDIGRVQEVREDVFVLNRPKGSDLLVPLSEVARIEGTVAYLRIEADRVVKMGWQSA